MKILLFHQFYTTGREAGISRFNSFISKWQESKAEVTVITSRLNYMEGKKKRKKLPKKEKNEKETTVIRTYSSRIGYRTFLGRMLSYITFIFSSFWKGMFVEKPDVVIASSPPISIGIAGCLVSWFRRIPFIFEVRDVWPDVAVELGFLKNKLLIKISRWIEKLLYKNADKVVVNSPGLKEYLIEKKGLPETKVTSIPNPAPISKKEENRGRVRKEKGWGGDFIVIYAGALSAVYDFETLLGAAGELKKESKIRFVIIGDGRQRNRIEKLIKKKNLSRTELLPAVSHEKIQDFLLSADCGIAVLKDTPHLSRVYATKILDYMSAGLPTVLAMKGVSAELVCDDSKSGICLPPGDKEGIAEAVKKLSGDRERSRELDREGKSYVTRHFNAEELASRYYELLKPLVVPERK